MIRSPNRPVIIVDDDVLVRDLLRNMLVQCGQGVHLATNGLQAIHLATIMNAALVIVDINMPMMNGIVTCESIRRLPGYRTTPIAMLTGNTSDRSRDAACQAGATTFLAKPFRPIEVLDALSPFLNIAPAMLAKLHQDAARARSIANIGPQRMIDGVTVARGG